MINKETFVALTIVGLLYGFVMFAAPEQLLGASSEINSDYEE